jgi:predicted enzyme related to lactoylglutathione lyase
MNLAKPRVDIGLNTNRLEDMLAFWQGEMTVPFDHVLPIRKGQTQHRHDLKGSVLKINHFEAPLPAAAPSGYAEVLIARPGATGIAVRHDPEGTAVALLPPGTLGIAQIGIKLKVRDLEAHKRFYADALGLAQIPHGHGAAFQAGETVLLLEESDDAPADAAFQGPGFRYITFQVFKCDEAHAHILAHGRREALAPTTLGTTARISMVRDPDGNWIEISQRASITGSLET